MSELQDLLQSVEGEVTEDLKDADDFLSQLQNEKTAVPIAAPMPTERWKKRNSDGNLIHRRPRALRNQCTQAGHSLLIDTVSAPVSASVSAPDVVFAPETCDEFMRDLQHSFADVETEEVSPVVPTVTSANWGLRKMRELENWRSVRPYLVNTLISKEKVEPNLCQECQSNAAAIRCRDCRPRPFLCGECDLNAHSQHPFHNREATIGGFFEPLPPTKVIINEALCHCDRVVPLEVPSKICSCPAEYLKLSAGKVVAVITMNGRHDLNIPKLTCGMCNATWTALIEDLIKNDFWPATMHYETIFACDIFFTFEEMKMVAPGLSCQAFIRMLDLRTVRFGRTGKISADSLMRSLFEWEAVRYEVDSHCKSEPFACPACSPEMFAVSVDGNRKHYRFNNAARCEEKAIFEGVFIADDEDVTQFVDHIQSKAKHVSGKGKCGGQWQAARETSLRSTSKLNEEGLELAVCQPGVLLRPRNMYRREMFAYPLYLQQKLPNSRFFCMDVTCKYWPYLQRLAKSCPELQPLLDMKPFLSVFHAKAHNFQCEVKWSGAYQEGAGLTLGEEVEQVNAFLSRIAVTTKHMSKAGRSDMLTLMAMRWNHQKTSNLAVFLSHRYLKTQELSRVSLKHWSPKNLSGV
nr:uncharacterized protein LOC129161959 [Nothobranchius furzeri]